ncbi:hypothetical protein GGR56DRAFT_602444 [Xylariaceae sp. FL0804]|nr:hypothetical protein GGR56DRAFT_602444 [Xylariaceae sp. FL0804]
MSMPAPTSVPKPSHADDQQYVVPEGLAAVIFAVCIFFSVISLGALALRMLLRLRTRAFGLDDGLMVIGLVVFLGTAALAALATWHGLGSIAATEHLLPLEIGMELFIAWQLCYAISLTFIKTSICVTLLRISVRASQRAAVYATLAVSIGTTVAGTVGTICFCRPIQANWHPSSTDKCWPRSVLVALNYQMSAGAIATDMACAVIPAWILWEAQMRRRSKISVIVILTMGSLASASTLCRFPYLKFYAESHAFLYHAGYIVLFSTVECGIGLAAGSLPMLRHYCRRCIGSSTRRTGGRGGASDRPSPPHQPDGSSTLTIGRMKARRPQGLTTTTTTAVAAAGSSSSGSGGSKSSRPLRSWGWGKSLPTTFGSSSRTGGGGGGGGGTTRGSTKTSTRAGDDGRDWELLDGQEDGEEERTPEEYELRNIIRLGDEDVEAQQQHQQHKQPHAITM